jgi:two-component system OmpR family sensor kinase
MLWHAAATAGILLAVAVSADWLLARTVFDQLDAALLVIAETEAGSAFDSPSGVHLHPLEPRPDARQTGLSRLDKLVQIIDNRGTVLLRSGTLGTHDLPVTRSLVERSQRGETVIETASWQHAEPIRMLTLPVRGADSIPIAIQVATPLEPTYAFLRATRLLWVVTAVAVLGVVIATGGWLARSALRPVSRAVEMAGQIGEAIAGRRLPHPGTDDEIGGLVTTLNAMLDRLERSMTAHRRFTADAAHELRTPLSHLRSELEIALRRSRTTDEYRDVVQSGLDESIRLTALTEALLTLARLDANRPVWPDQSAVGNTGQSIDAALARLATEAAARRTEVDVEPSPRCQVLVPASLLDLLVGNLIQNAIKFAPPGSRVVISTTSTPEEAVLAIADRGPGIPEDLVSKVFERFYRGERARSEGTEGFGLGLSICSTIVERYGGAIAVAPNPGGGSVFTVRLPLAGQASNNASGHASGKA